jgi:hypothetical protein
MESLSGISFSFLAERAIYDLHFQGLDPYSLEVIDRIAAFILLSPAAALDIATHTILVFPAIIYSIGKLIYLLELNFTLPWQHLQRIRNAVAPLIFGSVFGLIHPKAGLIISQPTDKHIVLGMLSSNVVKLDTPCSPIQSLSIIAELAESNRYAEKNGEQKEIFPPEYVKIINEACNFEKSLESLQAQEFMFKITNITLYVMGMIVETIKQSNLSSLNQEILTRLSGVLIPILTAVDVAITLLAQTFLLATGVIRLISDRGPIYTEVTTDPLMHVTFFLQNILKSLGNLIGTVVWFASPMLGFEASLLPSVLFFKLQMSIFMLGIRLKMYFAEENSKFVIPIAFGNGENAALSFPAHSMHKTYLIVEKKNELFNLYWVDRPNITQKKRMSSEDAEIEINSMLSDRFPFMDIDKMLSYPVKSEKPKFTKSSSFAVIAEQGGHTNCVVSNLFGMLEGLDMIKGENSEITELRYKAVRSDLMKNYSFYKTEYSEFSPIFSNSFWTYDAMSNIKANPNAPI